MDCEDFKKMDKYCMYMSIVDGSTKCSIVGAVTFPELNDTEAIPFTLHSVPLFCTPRWGVQEKRERRFQHEGVSRKRSLPNVKLRSLFSPHSHLFFFTSPTKIRYNYHWGQRVICPN